MNKARRKSLASIIGRLEELKEELESITADLEEIKDEEAEYFDNIPENLQNSERYERAETALDALESAHDTLTEIDLDEVIEQITEAIDA